MERGRLMKVFLRMQVKEFPAAAGSVSCYNEGNEWFRQVLYKEE